MLIAALFAAIIFLCIYIHSLLPVTVAICLAYLLSLSASLYLLSDGGPIAFKCAWLALIIAFPIGGAVLCFLSRVCSPKGGKARIFPPLTCGDCEYFDDGAKLLKRLTELISKAQKRVYLEFYIISKGHIWGCIFDELQLALKRGVEVKIIYDSWGSALRAPKRDFKTLKKAGAEIKVFNKLLPLPISRINVRDHRKIAVTDNAAFIGGVNIADEYAHLTSPHAFWKDGGALLCGRAAECCADLFLNLFSGKELSGYTPCYSAPTTQNDGGEFTVTPVADMPDRGGGVFEDAVASAIYRAERRVYIFTPYLCAGEKLCDALAYAARRGADVSVIIPAVPDKRLPFAITHTYADKLALKGVKIYGYTPGFMHFKGALFDDTAYIGSYNFDFRSTRLNYENGVFCTGPLAESLERDFLACLDVSRLEAVRKPRPLKRLARSVLCLFAPLV